MNMKIFGVNSSIKISSFCELFGIVILLLYSFSRLSWGFIIPSFGWGILLIISIILFSVCIICRRVHKKQDVLNYIVVVMLFIIVLNNYDSNIANINFWISILPYFCVVILFLSCSRSEEWINLALGIFMFFGLFYALFTILCMMDSSVYYNILYPILYSHYNILSYTPNPVAGFTAHYSTNGIYLAVALITVLSVVLFGVTRRFSHKQLFNLAKLIIIAVAFIYCGKRGIMIGIVGAIFVASFCYYADRKSTRLFRMIALLISLVFLVYILSLFVPSVSNFLDRFANLSSDNNVSQRFLLWNYTIEGFKENPIIGKGWRWVMNTNPILKGADSHNVYIQLLAEVGILGAIPFYIFFSVSFVRAIKLAILVRKKKDLVSIEQQGQIYFALMIITYNIIYMIEGTSFYMPECLLPYFISCSIIQYYWHTLNKKQGGFYE